MANQVPQIPGGKNKGTPLSQASEEDVRFWLGRKIEGIGDPAQAQYEAGSRRWIGEARKELIGRGIDPKDIPDAPAPGAAAPRAPATGGARPAQRAAAPTQTSALQRSEPQGGQMVIGSFGDGAAASAALAEAGKQYHLVAPTTVIGRLPEGCEVAISLVYVDPYGPEVYTITGDRKNPKPDDQVGLDRVALAKIGAAAGVTWLASHRTDNGSHPHYCAWEALARFPNFDMTYSDVPGNVDIDTREDGDVSGAAAQEIREKARKRTNNFDDGNGQLLELRKFLVRHCESKAMNKAIAGRGVRRSYKREDLRKAFTVAKIVFTGHSEDPEARADFRRMIGARFLGANQALYGAAPIMQIPAPQPHALHAPPATHVYVSPQQPALHAPPPLTASSHRVVDDPYGHDDDNEEPYADPPEKAAAPPPAAANSPDLKT